MHRHGRRGAGPRLHAGAQKPSVFMARPRAVLSQASTTAHRQASLGPRVWVPSLHHHHSEWNTAAGSSRHGPGDGTDTTLGLSLRESRPGNQGPEPHRGHHRACASHTCSDHLSHSREEPLAPLCRQLEPAQREPSKELQPGRTPQPQGPQTSLSGSCAAARGLSTRT